MNVLRDKMSEHNIQVQVCHYLDFLQNRFHFRYFAIPNGGARNAITGKMLKDEGVKKGVPDLFIPFYSLGFYGLFIEMKTAKGKLSKEQNEWLDYLKTQNFRSVVCYSFEDARKEIDYYFGVENPF